MKTYSLILLLLVLTTTSCTITKRRYTGGWHVEWNKRYKEQPAVSPHSKTEDNLQLQPETNEDIIQKEQGISENTDVILLESFPADTVRKSKKSQQMKKLSHKTDPENETSDAQKEKKKWVPYKYRKEQEEREDAERKRSNHSTPENEEPPSRSALDIVLIIFGSIAVIYFGYGSAVLIAVLSLYLFDFTIALSLISYIVALALAWIVFAGTTSLLLRMWLQKRANESHADFKKRLWHYGMLIGAALALITIILLAVILFL